MREHRHDTQEQRQSEALTAIADALDRLLESRCPRPSRLWQLAAGAECAPDERRHLVTCAPCRARVGQVAAAAGDAPATWSALAECAAVAAVKTRVARQRLSPLADQPLTFEADPHLEVAWCRDRAGLRWLDVKHRVLPPGLLLVFVLDTTGSPRSWVRHAMLRDGPPQAAARVRVEDAGGGERQLRVEGVDLEDIPSLPAAALRESFEAARRDDPDAVPHWRTWAREALRATGLPGRLRDVLGVIFRA
jgi:hypothetical protein